MKEKAIDNESEWSFGRKSKRLIGILIGLPCWQKGRHRENMIHERTQGQTVKGNVLEIEGKECVSEESTSNNSRIMREPDIQRVRRSKRER
jgi:hypothetical protein